MPIEAEIASVKRRHGLSTCHIFDDAAGGRWQVFSFRRDAKGYQASAESGAGETISAAISDLDRRLTEGPIHK